MLHLPGHCAMSTSCGSSALAFALALTVALALPWRAQL